MDIILVRYAEVGLKSPSVRRYFESILIDNMMNALAGHGIEALVDSEQGRMYVTTDRIPETVEALTKVFGVASVSPALIAQSTMEEMGKAAAEFSRGLLSEGSSFAIKARREGNHPYHSIDVGREVGSAVFLANEDKHVRVDLTHPDVTIYVEVRGARAFIFSEYLSGPGGLPMGSQGKVVAVVNTEQDALAAWAIMKRGCRVIALGSGEGIELLRRWDPRLKVLTVTVEEALVSVKAMAVVYGYRLEDMPVIKAMRSPVPSFFPLIGMSEEEIRQRITDIKQ